MLRLPRRSTLFPYTTLFRSLMADMVILDWQGITPAQYNAVRDRSEEHTSELQSRFDLVCRLLLEKKKQTQRSDHNATDDPRPTACATLVRRADITSFAVISG